MRTVMDRRGYLCMTIPTIKRRNMGGYEESQHANHAIIKVWNIHAISYNTNRYVYSISIEKEVAFDYYRKHHMQALFALLKQKYLFSRRRNFGRHHTSVFSIENNLQNLKKRLQVIEQKMKNYKMNSPLRFLGKCRWESDQRAITLSRWRCKRSIFECYCLEIPSRLVPEISWEEDLRY